MRMTRCSCLALLVLAVSCSDRAAPPPAATPEAPRPAVEVTPCVVSAPAEVFVPPTGGPEQVAVTASPEDCSPDAWTARIIDRGGSITGLSPAGGRGSGSFTVTAADNSGAARTGVVRVTPSSAAPLDIAVRQSARHCTFNVEANTSTVSSSINSAHITVTNLEGCSWRAAVYPNPGNFLQFYDRTSDGGQTANATGTAVLHLRVAENGAPPGQRRSGTVRITSLVTGAEVGRVTVTQAGTSRPDPRTDQASRTGDREVGVVGIHL